MSEIVTATGQNGVAGLSSTAGTTTRAAGESQSDWIVFLIAWTALSWQAAWVYWFPQEVGVIVGAAGCIAACWMVGRKSEWRSSGNYPITLIVAALATVAISVAAFNLLQLQILPERLFKFSGRPDDDLRIAFGIGGALIGWLAAWIFAAVAMNWVIDARRGKCAALFSGAFASGLSAILILLCDAGKELLVPALLCLPVVWLGLMCWPISVGVSILSLALMATTDIWWPSIDESAVLLTIITLSASGFAILIIRYRDVPARIIAGNLLLLAGVLVPVLPNASAALGMSADALWVTAALSVFVLSLSSVTWAWRQGIENSVLWMCAFLSVNAMTLAIGEITTSFELRGSLLLAWLGALCALWVPAFVFSYRQARSTRGDQDVLSPRRFAISRFGLDCCWFTPLICAWFMIIITAFTLDRPLRLKFVQNLSPDAWIKEIYLWPDEVRFDMRVDLFGIPRAGAQILDARIDRGRDPYSTAAKNDGGEVSWSEHYTHGFSCLIDNGRQFVLDVIDGSSAAQAGLTRGATIISIAYADGEDRANQRKAPAFCGKPIDSLPIDITTTLPGGSDRTIRVDPTTGGAKYATTAFVERMLLGSKAVVYVKGLLWGSNNSHPVARLMDRAWRLEADELILDLRESRGRFVTGAAVAVANHIIGETANEMPFLRTTHNATYRVLDRTIVVNGKRDMELKRVVVLTSRRTCGAAEALINGLRPYVEVVTVGERSCGRPYEFDELGVGGNESIFLITMRVSNSRGESEYTDGIAPDCRIEDNSVAPAGTPGDSVLEEALRFLRTGQCSDTSGRKSSSGSPLREKSAGP